jgi:hypothetical protein
MVTKPTYRYAISFDDECKAIIERIVEDGKANTFTDGVRYCVRAQEKK